MHCHLCCMDSSLLDLISIRKTHYLTLHAGWLTDGIFSKRKTYCLLLLYGEWLIAESRFYKEGSLFDITLQRMTPWILFQKGRLTVCYNFMQDDSLLSLVSIRNAHKILLLDAGWLIAESGFYKERSLYSMYTITYLTQDDSLLDLHPYLARSFFIPAREKNRILLWRHFPWKNHFPIKFLILSGIKLDFSHLIMAARDKGIFRLLCQGTTHSTQ